MMAIAPRKLHGLGLGIGTNGIMKLCGIAGAFFGYKCLGYYVWGIDPMASKWTFPLGATISSVLIVAVVYSNQRSQPKPKRKFSKAQMAQLVKAWGRSKLSKHQQNVKQLDARDARLARQSGAGGHDKEV